MIKPTHGFNWDWWRKGDILRGRHFENITVIFLSSPFISALPRRIFFTSKPGIPRGDPSSAVPYRTREAHKLPFQLPRIFIVDKCRSSSQGWQFALAIVIEMLGVQL